MQFPSAKEPWPLARQIEEVKAAGFDGFSTADGPEHAQLAEQHGLPLIGFISSGEQRRVLPDFSKRQLLWLLQSYLTDPAYIYHFDLGDECLFDAADGKNGVYFYDFKSNGFFYNSPNFPCPYLYGFGLDSTVYYYPDSNNAGHYNADGVRYFYVFNTGKIISK